MKLSLLRHSPVAGIDGPLGEVADALVDGLRWVVRGLWVSRQESAGRFSYFVPLDRLVHPSPARRTFCASFWRQELRGGQPLRGTMPLPAGCSGKQLIDCRLYATDGACGRVKDIVINERWGMVGLLVEAESWLHLPPSLATPRDIDHIDVLARAVHSRRSRRELARRPHPADTALRR